MLHRVDGLTYTNYKGALVEDCWSWM